MTIAQMKDKYNPFKSSKRPLRCAADSQAITDLLEYLGKNEEHGVSLVEIEGDPAISFKPGLKKDEHERFIVACKAEALLMNAASDLRELMRSGGMRLKHKR